MRYSINASKGISEKFTEINKQIIKEIEESFSFNIDERQFIDSLKKKYTLPFLEAENSTIKSDFVNKNIRFFIKIPFKGPRELFAYNPSRCNIITEKGIYIEGGGSGKDQVNSIVIEKEFDINTKEEIIRSRIQRIEDSIRENIQWYNDDIKNYNSNIEGNLDYYLNKKKAELKKYEEISKIFSTPEKEISNLNINKKEISDPQRSKNAQLLEDLEKELNFLENENILGEFKQKEFTLLKKEGLGFLIRNFQLFNLKKKTNSIILINIGYLSNTMKSGIQFEDIDFLSFIINLLSTKDFFNYGLISFHLLLNRYVRYDQDTQGYDNYYFQQLIKEIDEIKRDSLYQIIIKGLSNNQEIEKNANQFFELLSKHIPMASNIIDNLSFITFFDKIFKSNIDLLKKYKTPLFTLVDSHISQIFHNDNIFTVFKHIYVNLYNKDEEIFQKIDEYLEKSIENIDLFSKLIDLINLMVTNSSHLFYKKFYKKYFNLSYQLKKQRRFTELGLLWNTFNIYSLRDLKSGELCDKEFFKTLLDDFKIVLSSGESSIFNARYMQIEKLLRIRPISETIKPLEKTKEEKGKLTEDNLIQILITDIASLQQKNRAIKEEEDKYTVILSEMLNRSLVSFNYFTDVQDLSGKTEKSENKNPELGGMGELDLRFLNENHELCHIGEALILDSMRTDCTKAHLKKIFDYDANGLPINFMIIYSRGKEFNSLWQKYSNFVKNYDFKYQLIEKEFFDLSDKLSKYSGIKIGLTNHLRDGRICKLYHFFIDFN